MFAIERWIKIIKMKSTINRNKIIIIIIAIVVASFSIYYATAGIFKTNTPVVNDLTSGLVGYWTFDGQDTDWGTNTVNDMSTNSNNGTMINISTSTDAVSGIIGQALDFDGDNNYVDVPDSASLRVADGDFSVSFWLKRDAISSVIENLVGTENGVSNYLGWSIRLGGSDTISFYVNDGAGQKLAGGGEVLVVNEWYHFVGVVDSGNTIYYYLNGTLQDSTSLAGETAFEKNYGLDIGNIESGSNRYFNGSIDEVRIYDRALSVSEVTELYNQGAKRLTIINKNQKTDLVPTGLTGYWSFDGEDMDWGTNNSNVVIDRSGNGKNGQVSNMSTTTSPVPGIIGQALKLRGVDSNVNIEKVQFVKPNNFITADEGAISVWVKPMGTALDESDVYLINGIVINTGQTFGIYRGKISGNNEGIYFYNWDGDDEDTFFTTYNTNEWVHLVWQHTGGTLYGYKNGVQIGSTASGDTSGIASGSTRIGTNDYSSAYNNTGDEIIDELRFYNRALSPSEITELYNQGAEKLLKVNMPQTDLIPNGLVGYWTFDGQDTNWGTNKTNDLSGNSNTGTMTSMSTSTSPVAGIVGQALNFDGVDGYVLISDDSSLDGFAQATWTFWLNPLSTSAGTILDKYDCLSGGRALRIQWDSVGDGDISLTISSDGVGNEEKEASNLKIGLNAWHHVVLTFDNGVFKSYLNGVEKATEGNFTTHTSIYSGSSDLEIGKRRDSCGNGNYFNGTIDEVRMYNRALSANEIKELYMAGVGR